MGAKKEGLKYAKKFGSFLEFYRNRKGLSAYKLQGLAEITDNSIRKYEMNTRQPSMENFVRLATGFGLTPSELFKEFEDYLNSK